MQLPDRSALYKTIPEHEALANYRRNYGVGDEIGIAEVRQHAALEAQLTDRLLLSSPSDRWDTFSTAYTQLYSDLPWLANVGTLTGASAWQKLMKPGSKIFEVGSGPGVLISFLAGQGFDCYATEITKERGERLIRDSHHITWRTTDGVHLDQFESAESFDYVLSDQVVEHLHPDDISTHFESAQRILKPGGTYIVRTPHRSLGPHDLSLVFGLNQCVFMHLHEFTFREIENLARQSGFKSARAVLSPPWIGPRLNVYFASRIYLRYLLLLEKLESFLLKKHSSKQKFWKAARYLALGARDVWICLQK